MLPTRIEPGLTDARLFVQNPTTAIIVFAVFSLTGGVNP
jgi:hypothetical protein